MYSCGGWEKDRSLEFGFARCAWRAPLLRFLPFDSSNTLCCRCHVNVDVVCDIFVQSSNFASLVSIKLASCVSVCVRVCYKDSIKVIPVLNYPCIHSFTRLLYTRHIDSIVLTPRIFRIMNRIDDVTSDRLFHKSADVLMYVNYLKLVAWMSFISITLSAGCVNLNLHMPYTYA